MQKFDTNLTLSSVITRSLLSVRSIFRTLKRVSVLLEPTTKNLCNQDSKTFETSTSQLQLNSFIIHVVVIWKIHNSLDTFTVNLHKTQQLSITLLYTMYSHANTYSLGLINDNFLHAADQRQLSYLLCTCFSHFPDLNHNLAIFLCITCRPAREKKHPLKK